MTFRPRVFVLLLLLACLIPLGFAAFTHHAWEDYFITLRASRNLVEGHGLVFTPGQRVHSYTSPLGVLVPALCTALAGTGREEAALWLFRLLNAGCLAAAAVLVWRRFDSLKGGSTGRWLYFGLVLADAKLTDFSSNGMETALLVLFTLLLWTELERPEGLRPAWLAAAVAGLMWTRPDGFVLAGALLAPHFVLRPAADTRPRLSWRGTLLGLGGAALLYLPWFAWAWWYYGTPVPHTITAKAAMTMPVTLSGLLATPWHVLTGTSLLGDLFLPTYWARGGWPEGLAWGGQLFAAVAAVAWVLPVLPGRVRRISLTVFLGMFYLCTIILFPWYCPPWTVLASLALAGVANHAAACPRQNCAGWMRPLVRSGVALVVGIQFLVLAGSAWQMRVQQRLIEDAGRREIGLWLHAHAAPGDTVLLECLGYIGYYSNLKMYDYPGLSSPEVVAAIRQGYGRYAELIGRLRPVWLVLRPDEIADPRQPGNAALRDYELVKVWDRRPALDAVPFLPGRPWLNHDALFLVLRRKDAAK